jgi:hypothetical protein
VIGQRKLVPVFGGYPQCKRQTFWSCGIAGSWVDRQTGLKSYTACPGSLTHSRGWPHCSGFRPRESSGTSRLWTSRTSGRIFVAYGLLGTLVCRTGVFWEPGTRGMRLAVLMASLYGVSDEWHQSLVPGRYPDLADWVADIGGAMLAVLLYARVVFIGSF